MIRKTAVILFLAFVTRYAGSVFAATGRRLPPECVTDSMEIVTWYPSPYNEYEELRLYPINALIANAIAIAGDDVL